MDIDIDKFRWYLFLFNKSIMQINLAYDHILLIFIICPGLCWEMYSQVVVDNYWLLGVSEN